MSLSLLACVLMLLGGYLLKAQCAGPEGWDGRQYSRLCYNDVQPLYGVRAIDVDQFPYVEGRLQDQELTGGAIEYPVLTGVFMWLAGLLVDDSNAYLRMTSLLLAPFALISAYLLGRMTGRRALMWSAAPALILYSFHNWDLLAVAATVTGMWFWWRDRDLPAAVLFGVGAAFKLYPLFFLAPLVLYVARKCGWARALGTGGAGAATLVAINLPFGLANFDGWMATYRFHSLRVGNFDSIWNLGFPSLDAATLNLVTGALTGLGFMVALAVGWVRSKGGGAYPFLQVSAAMLAAFMLFSKVHSPQYTLWLLPFFVVTPVGIGWWIAYSSVDLAVYIGVFRWFYDISYQAEDFTFFKKLMIAGVWGRALLLAALYFVFLRARPAPGQEAATRRAPLLSHPPHQTAVATAE